MSLACQKNSYLRELLTKVVSCVAAKEGFEVTLEDSVLFPEGGGQPWDVGRIGESRVTKVFRRAMQTVHVADRAVDVGSEQKCEVDWTRRFDHMQQHSAQHLLSAIAESRFGYGTVSWDLGKSVCHVELDTAAISSEEMSAIEAECNEHIREHKAVSVRYLSMDEAMGLEEVKSRGLPEGCAVPIRVIVMDGVDKNMCCGTHVSNLSDLQMIKLLHTEPMRGGLRLFFIAGNRVLRKLDMYSDVERNLNKTLSCGIEDHVATVDRMKTNVRLLQKNLKTALREAAKFEARDLAKLAETSGYIFHHKDDGDMDYIFTFLNELKSLGVSVPTVVCAGAVKEGGQFVVSATGDDTTFQSLSTNVLQLFEAKGGGKKGQLQGKAKHFKNLKQVEELLKSLSVVEVVKDLQI